MRSLVLLLLLAPLPVSLSAQSPAARDSFARAEYASNADEYAAERAALARAGGRVSREGGALRLRLRGGDVVLADTIVEGDGYHRFVYEGDLLAGRLHVVRANLYEGTDYLVFTDRAGDEVLVPGPPITSPDGLRFLAASCDLEAGYDPNRLEVWRITPRGLRRELVLDGAETWCPEEVRWAGRTRIRFFRATIDSRILARRRSPRIAVLRGGRWTVSRDVAH